MCPEKKKNSATERASTTSMVVEAQRQAGVGDPTAKKAKVSRKKIHFNHKANLNKRKSKKTLVAAKLGALVTQCAGLFLRVKGYWHRGGNHVTRFIDIFLPF